ncbi:hypothetical protein [Mesoflavibacter zeaxanthinifaciens]|uniref:hypothetical protein n=1 Tax=Mesoflavibacter zeaxanthinifaciens TaxID=393060 RepID=UPI003A950E82
MRKGINTSKEQIIQASQEKHRIILPLYIPNETDYYTSAFEVFEMCITSLSTTSTYPYLLTVIADGCCTSVTKKLYDLHTNKIIDELIIENRNIGKLNAILKGLRTVTEPFVTIADADILFLNNWDVEVFKVFKMFKKAAVVSPIPIFRNQLSYTANIWLDYLFSSKLKFRSVKNPEALEQFAKSIGWSSLENRFKNVIVTLKEDDVITVISATHCVATYKTSYLRDLPKMSSMYKLGGDSERKYLDEPPYIKDGYRLSTYDNYAYHLGNSVEDWQRKVYTSLIPVTTKQDLPEIVMREPKMSVVRTFLKKIFLKLLTYKTIYNFLLLRKGLTRTQLKQFWY